MADFVTMLLYVLVATAAILFFKLGRRPPKFKYYPYQPISKAELIDYPAGLQFWTEDGAAEKPVRKAQSGTAAIEPRTVMEVFGRAVSQRGSETALVTAEGKQITWRQYYNDTRSAARAMIKMGVKGNDSVNILGFNSPEWLIGNLAAIAAGSRAAGIYATNTPPACEYIARHSDAVVVLVENKEQLGKMLKVADNLPRLKALVVWTGDAPESKSSNYQVFTWRQFLDLGGDEKSPETKELDARIAAARPGVCSTLIYTSGTTGDPKAVMMSHDNLTWTAQTILDTMNVGIMDERVISYLPLSHIAAQMTDIHVPLAVAAYTKGNATVFFARPDALKGTLGVTLKAARPTLFFGVPRVWEKFAEGIKKAGSSATGLKKKIAVWAKAIGLEAYKNCQVGGSGQLPRFHGVAKALVFDKVRVGLGLDACRNFFVGAAPISDDTLYFFGSLGICICNLYGMSESSGPHTISCQDYYKVGSCGKLMNGAEMKIDHEDGRDRKGEGEICYRGRHIMMGYMKDSKKSAETIDKDGWLHSGDVGRVDSDGMLFITGRIKELLIGAGGENVAPIPVEEQIKSFLPALSNVMMVGDRMKYMTVLVTLKTEPDLDTGGYKDKLVAEAMQVSSARTVAEATNDPKWKAYITEGIERANKVATSNACRVQKFAILPVDFSIPGGELGPTLKLKRNVVVQKYADVIKSLYPDDD